MDGSNAQKFSLASWRVYWRFWPQVRIDRRALVLDTATVVVAVATNTALIWLIGLPFTYLQQQEIDRIAPVLAVFAATLLLNQAMQVAGEQLTQWVGFRAIGRIRNAILTHLLHLSFPSSAKFAKGDLLTRLGNDVDMLKACIVDAPVNMGAYGMTLALYVCMLFWIDPTLALFALLIIPAYVVHQRYFSVRKRHTTQKFLERRATLLAYEEEVLTNLRSISTANAESRMADRHAEIFENARVWAMRNMLLEYQFSATFTLLIYLSGLFILYMGLQELRQGRLDVGALVSFLLYLGYLTVPVRGISQILLQLSGNRAAAERVLEVLDQAPTVRELPAAPPLAVTRGTIALHGLSFSFPGGRPLFNALDLTIAGGETVALVGPSGVGKSTLVNLLLRFYEPDYGSITIDGQDIRTVSLASLRSAIAMVWQEPLLISASIRENLLMVKPDADEAALLQSCAASHAQEFIRALPRGLETHLGTGGVTLSAGQKQRLAIAQAFLRNAPILVLDEATSALDSHSERTVVTALEALRRERTTLIIAHRYSSIQAAERVLYFNGDGTLTVGPHTELMSVHSGYRAAVEWQTGHAPATGPRHVRGP